MDSKNCLVILKDEDKTDEVVKYKEEELYTKVLFAGSDKEYSYKNDEVVIENAENPKIREMGNESVYLNGRLLLNVKEIRYFKNYARIVFEDENTIAAKIADLKFDKNNELATKLMTYFFELSKHISDEEENKDSFLHKEYTKLRGIDEDSVLAYYINRKPLLNNIERDNRSNIYPFGFNLSQKAAVENVYRSNISVIEGPPGTGKTQTILNIIANLAIMENKSIAVVSGNNEAVRNVRDKLNKKGYGFIVANLGNKDNIEKFFEDQIQPKVDEWAEDINEETVISKLRELNTNINYLLNKENEKAILSQRLTAYELEQKHFNIYYEKLDIKSIKKMSFYNKTPERVLAYIAETNIAIDREVQDKLLHKLKMFIKYGATRQKDTDINSVLQLQKQYYELKILELKNDIEKIENELKLNTFNVLKKQHEKYSKILFEHRLYKRYKGKSNDFDKNHFRDNYSEFIESFPVVLSTTHSIRNCIAEGFKFDYLIMDESSQVDLVTGALALSCVKNAIIVGDTKQLPQVIRSDVKERIEYDIDISEYDFFDNSLLASIKRVYKDTVPSIVLKEHYRCHPTIIEFCNQRYYKGELIPFPNEEHLKQRDPFLLYYTAKGHHMRQITIGNKDKKYNLREIECIDDVLCKEKVIKVSDDDIGFTTPYRYQADTAANILNNPLIQCDTIHKYQGKEKQLMILSTVLDDTAQGRWGIRFVDDPNKINVAVSRAINQFVIITDNSLFNKCGTEVKALINYIKYSNLDATIIDSKVVSVFDLLYSDYDEVLKKFEKKLVNVSKYKSENIMYTLLLEILKEEKYSGLKFSREVLLKNMFTDLNILNDREKSLLNHNSALDFAIYDNMSKMPILAIETDGFAFHENNPKQLERDNVKDNILKKYEINFMRIKEHEANIRQKIMDRLDEILGL